MTTPHDNPLSDEERDTLRKLATLQKEAERIVELSDRNEKKLAGRAVIARQIGAAALVLASAIVYLADLRATVSQNTALILEFKAELKHVSDQLHKLERIVDNKVNRP